MGPWPLIELKDMGNREREREREKGREGRERGEKERQVQGDWTHRVRRVGGGGRDVRGCKRMT